MFTAVGVYGAAIVMFAATPNELLGRVSAAHSTSITASNQLGQFRPGAVAEYTGPVAGGTLRTAKS